MTKYGILLLAGLLWSAHSSAQENKACRMPDYDYQSQSTMQLRAIAASCHSEQVARLYYNRAYHAELLQEGEALSRIVSVSGRETTRHLQAYRLYMALLEAFARNWNRNIQDRAAFLNREYDRRSEVVELRLHGYDRLADLKEAKMLLP